MVDPDKGGVNDNSNYGWKTGCGWVIIAGPIALVLRLFGVDVPITWPTAFGVFIVGTLLGYVFKALGNAEEKD
jgi:hypothetical protein